MNYEKIESDRYENMWHSMRGEFHPEKTNYKSNIPSDELLDFILFLKKNKTTGTVLDLGCGNGRNSVELANNGFNVTGIDISQSALDLAKKNMIENKVIINLKKESVFSLKQKNKYNVVIDFGLLHHLRKSQWNNYLKNVLNVLMTEGFYCLHVFSANTENKLKPKNKNWRLIGKHYDHFFSKSELNSFLSKHFKIIKIIDSENKRTKIKFMTIYALKIK